MVGCIQSGLWVLTEMFCKVEDLVADESNVLFDQNSDPELKVPNPKFELPYAYLEAWLLCFVHP